MIRKKLESFVFLLTTSKHVIADVGDDCSSDATACDSLVNGECSSSTSKCACKTGYLSATSLCSTYFNLSNNKPRL